MFSNRTCNSDEKVKWAGNPKTDSCEQNRKTRNVNSCLFFELILSQKHTRYKVRKRAPADLINDKISCAPGLEKGLNTN
jgi:hypothetical protein